MKTSAEPASFWLVGPKAGDIVVLSHIYVFVNIRPPGTAHNLYVVPSKNVARLMRVEQRPNSTWYSVFRADIGQYELQWKHLGA